TGIVERAQEPGTCLLAAIGLRVIDRERLEVRVHLKKYVGRAKAEIAQLAPELVGAPIKVFEFTGWPQMRPTLKQANVNSLEFEHRNKLQSLLVRKQREREISASKFICHGWNTLLFRHAAYPKRDVLIEKRGRQLP